MTLRTAIGGLLQAERLNFVLTNRLPRRLATKAMGRWSRIEHPLVSRLSIATWRFFADVDLSDATEARYHSLHAAFVRGLKPGARPFDSDPAFLSSPCDAILGAHGTIEGDQVHQIKGYPYRLGELLGDGPAARSVEGGVFATLRLTAGMYHRFHAPSDLTVEAVTYRSGDCWNVNPVALKRVERLYCRNERAVIETRLANGVPLLLVPVAAILVAGIRLTMLDTERLVREQGAARMTLSAPVARGEEMGWFEHGSTILVLAPPGFSIFEELAEGDRLCAGQRLFRIS